MPVFEYHLHPHIPTFAWPFPFRSQAYFLSPYGVSRSFYPPCLWVILLFQCAVLTMFPCWQHQVNSPSFCRGQSHPHLDTAEITLSLALTEPEAFC